MMKTFSKTRVLIAAAGFLSVMAASSASAEYRVTVFGHTAGYSDLLSKDAATAASYLKKRSASKMNYLELNNLCVTEILLKEFEAAVASCGSALSKASTSYDLSVRVEKTVKASIYSNMAVAKAMSGDVISAKVDLETALSLNARDKNANSNYGVIAASAAESEIAGR